MAELDAGKVGIEIEAKNKTDKATKEVNKNLESIGSTAEKSKSKLLGIFAGVGFTYKVGKQIVDLTRKSADYIETLNVLDVAFNDNTKSIRNFTKNISETLNLDDASLLKMASSFKMLGNSMGYTEEMGNKFSRLMTQMNVDTASLFNMSLADTQSMLQSAVQGQTKTLRMKTGVSVLDRDVQTTLDVLGIDAYVEDMNSAEKSLARVITMTYRLRDSQGDLARTIEAPANQFRVLTEQITMLGRNIGNVFLPAVAAILPYLNAVFIVLNKLISSLAALLGFKENAWDTFTKKTDSLSEAFDTLGSSVGGVGSAAKETKKQLSGLREFDKLNVIKTPTASGTSGGGGGTGINKNLLDAFNKMFDNYNSMLDGVETKATKIAKAIMKALKDTIDEFDFTNLIEAGQRLWTAFKPFAENVGKGLLWTFNNVLKPLAKWTISDLLPSFLNILADAFIILNNSIETLKPMAEWIWKSFLKPLAKWTGGTIVNVLKNLDSALRIISKNKLVSTVFTGGVIFATFSKNIGKLVTVLGKSKLTGVVSNLIKPMKSLYDNTKLYTNLAKKDGGSLIEGIKAGNDAWRKQQGILKEVTDDYGRVSTKLNGITGVINGTKVAVSNLAIAAVGLEGLKVALDDAATSGLNLGNSLGALTGAATTISSTMTAGAVFGPWGAAIGGAVGALEVLYTSLDTLAGKTKTSTDLINEQKDAIQKLNDKALENIDIAYTQADRASQLSTELGKYVDANGKVTGSTEKVNSILDELNGLLGTEFKVTGDTITQNGKKIKSLQGIQSEIDKYISKLKAQVIQEQVQSLYSDALDKQIKAMQQRNEKAEIINELTQKAIDNNGILSYEEKQRLEKAKEDYANLSASIDGYQKNMDNYSKAGQEAVKGNFDTAVEYLTKSEKGVYKSFDELVKNGDTNISKSITNMQKSIQKLGDTKIKIQGTVEVDRSGIDKLQNQLKKQKVTFKTSSGSAFVGSFDISKKANGGIFVNGAWRDIAQYDTGGLPPVGQMFVARERGPELVGNIGGHTAVMNNNQIVSSVSAGVYQAVRGAMGNVNSGNGVYNIYLDKDHKLGTYTLDQLQQMAKSNGRPITIG